jgi:hypothetical protein
MKRLLRGSHLRRLVVGHIYVSRLIGGHTKWMGNPRGLKVASQLMNSMATFDPALPARVHDRLSDRTFEWLPEWRINYEMHALPIGPGVIEWDSLLLDGWLPLNT